MNLPASRVAFPGVPEMKESDAGNFKSNCSELIPVAPGLNPKERVTLDPWSPETELAEIFGVCANA